MLSPRADDHAAVVFDDLASALEAGLPLRSVGAETDDGDRALHAALRRRGVQLTDTEQLALEVGWRSGRGAEALRRGAENRRQRAEFLRSIRQSCAYPVLLLVALLGASLATMALIGPWVFTTVLVVEVALAAFATAAWRGYRQGRAGMETWPFVGRLVADVRELPYLEALHALYSAGVPIRDAHPEAVRGVRMQDLRRRLEISDALLVNGRPLHECLAESAALSPETRTLLATGEQAGQLEDALERAIRRRREVAGRTLVTTAKRVGQAIYVLAVVGAVVLILLFYSRFAGLYSSALR